MSSLTNSEKQRALLIGFLAGVLAGLFGVGGGFLMVPLYLAWLKIDQKKAHATSLGAVVPIAIAGAIGYASTGDVDWNSAAYLLAGSFFGAMYGAKLLHSISLPKLQLVFGILLTLSAARLLWSAEPSQLLDGLAGHTLLVFVGFFAGTMSGLLGIGGGIIMVPAMIIASGLNAVEARGTSLAVIVGSGISGTYAHYKRGNIIFPVAILSGVAGIPATFIGIYLSHNLPERISVAIFAAILFTIAFQQFKKSIKSK
jgi:uncharacterized membrane protein YfcA